MDLLMPRSFTDSFIYRYRHIIGFFVVGFLLYYFVCFGFARVPSGLGVAEINSAMLSANFTFPTSIVDLPYHALQWLSVQIFGLSTFAIRWPSIVLALLVGALTIMAIRNLYKSNVAIITGIIVASSVFFLEIARSGSPAVMSVLLLILAIFSFSQYLVSKSAKSFWLLLAVLSLVVTTYSPLGIYLLVSSIILAIFHPKIRSAILRFKVYQIILVSLVAILLLAPLIITVAFDPSIIWTLLGVDNIQWSAEVTGSNLAMILLPWNNAVGLITPMISFAGMAVAIIGVATLIRDRYSARSYMTLGLVVLALIFTIINTNFVYTLCVPMTLLIAAGFNTLISSWYSLFPANLIARLTGLIPLSILIIGMIVTSYMRYTNNNLYNDDVVYARDHTFEAVRDTINKHSAHTVNLIVTENEMPFYGLLERDYSNLVVGVQKQKSADTVILIPSTFHITKELVPSQVITGWTRHNNILVKVYD
jgi:hypothetical protein